MRRTSFILLTLAGILLAVILLVDKETPEGQGRRLFEWHAAEIREIQFQGMMRHHDGEIPIRYSLQRKKAASSQEKAKLQAEVSEPQANDNKVTRILRFALGAPANAYFEELHKLTAFYTLPDDETTRKELGFTSCETRVTLLRHSPESAETIFCLGPLTYNKARQYVLIPGEAIHITYRHIWQRYENSVYALADTRLIPETDLYNRLEIVLSRSYGEKNFPNLFQKSGGRLILQPRRQTVGVKKDKETVIWEFENNQTLPAHLAPRLQGTLEALRFSHNLREPEVALAKEPAFGIRLARRDKNSAEQTINMIRFFPPEKKIPLASLDGKPTVQGPDWLSDNQSGFGLLRKADVEKFVNLLSELEKFLQQR